MCYYHSNSISSIYDQSNLLFFNVKRNKKYAKILKPWATKMQILLFVHHHRCIHHHHWPAPR